MDREWHWKYKCDIDWIFRPAELYMIADVAPHLGIPNHDLRERVVSESNDFLWVEVRSCTVRANLMDDIAYCV